MGAFVLIWIFSSPGYQPKAFSGSAEFNTFQACEEARKEIQYETGMKFEILKCYPKGEK